MGWIFGAVVVALIVIIGTSDYTANKEAEKPPQDTENYGCDDCKAKKKWYDGLSGWQKLRHAAWRAWIQAVCIARGCGW